MTYSYNGHRVKELQNPFYLYLPLYQTLITLNFAEKFSLKWQLMLKIENRDEQDSLEVGWIQIKNTFNKPTFVFTTQLENSPLYKEMPLTPEDEREREQLKKRGQQIKLDMYDQNQKYEEEKKEPQFP